MLSFFPPFPQFQRHIKKSEGEKIPKVELQISIYGVKILDPKTKVCNIYLSSYIVMSNQINSNFIAHTHNTSEKHFTAQYDAL